MSEPGDIERIEALEAQKRDIDAAITELNDFVRTLEADTPKD